MDRAALRNLDLRHVWHPYTQAQDLAASDFPIIVAAEGRELVDADGRRWLDGTSSMWLNVHGHRVPELDDAIRRQLERVAHSTLLGQGSEPSIRLAAELARRSGLQRVFYSDNGSTAVEAALKLALQMWRQRGRPGKRRFASFDGAYHGDTLGAIAVAPVPDFHQAFLHLLPQPPLRLPWPDVTRGPHAGDPEATREWALHEADAVLRRHHGELAAVVVEPIVQFVGGLRIMPPGYLRGLRELCTTHDVLLLTDEVATGVGRTGAMFAQDLERVHADIMAVGKGLTGGYLPLAATLVAEEVHEAFLGLFEERRAFYHGHSYTGNALGCAAALANLELLDRLLPGLAAKADVLNEGLAPLENHPHVLEVRQVGLAAGVDLVADKRAREPFAWEARAGWCVHEEAKARGLLARPYASTGLLVPPLGSTPDELRRMAAIYRQAVDAATPRLRQLAAVRSAVNEVPA